VRGNRDLQLAAVGAVVCALVAALVPFEPLRIAAGLPLALFLPGYALTALAFGAARIAPGKTLLLSTAMSLATLIVGSLLLSLVGIYTGTWALLLALVTVACCRGAAMRRGERPRRSVERRHLSSPALALLLAGLALFVGAIVLAQMPFSAKQAGGYTALWMLPGDNGRSVEVGVVSARHVEGPYILEVEAGDEPAISKTFRLDPGEEQIYRLPVPAVPNERVVASLYKEGKPADLYRRVLTFMAPEDRS
jgi:uncharacterized membrane protein